VARLLLALYTQRRASVPLKITLLDVLKQLFKKKSELLPLEVPWRGEECTPQSAELH